MVIVDLGFDMHGNRTKVLIEIFGLKRSFALTSKKTIQIDIKCNLKDVKVLEHLQICMSAHFLNCLFVSFGHSVWIVRRNFETNKVMGSKMNMSP